MPEVPLNQLDKKQQRQVENARFALDRANYEYTISLCQDVLEAEPGCLQVRKLLRTAQRKHLSRQKGLWLKLKASLAGLPWLVAASFHSKKNPRKALVLLERALTYNPDNVHALRQMVHAARRLNLMATAVFACEGACEVRPSHQPSQYELCQVYLDADDAASAVALAERLLRQTPSDGRAQEILKFASVAHSIRAGNWNSESDSFRDKLKDEQKAVSLEQASKAIASVDMTERLLGEAIARVDQEPDRIDHYKEVVRLLLSLGRREDAILWLERATALPGGNADAVLAGQESELRLSLLEEKLQTALENHEPTEVVETIRNELTQFRLQEARHLVEKFPNDLNHRFSLGDELMEHGHLDEAIKQFQMAQKNPKYRLPALVRLGSCFERKHLYDLAIQQHLLAKSELTGMDEMKKQVVYALAGCYEKMGQQEKAMAEYKLIYAVDIGFRDVADKINAHYSTTAMGD